MASQFIWRARTSAISPARYDRRVRPFDLSFSPSGDGPTPSDAGPVSGTVYPLRPARIPEDATWDAAQEEWLVGAVDEQGRRHGSTRSYRTDGSFAGDQQFNHGILHGSYKRLHPSGRLARMGQNDGGLPVGLEILLRDDIASPEDKAMGPLDVRVWRCERERRNGRVLATRYFDSELRPVTARGEPMPARPAGVPPEAMFDSDRERWFTGQENETGASTGLWRYWTREGILDRQIMFQNGVAAWDSGERRDDES